MKTLSIIIPAYNMETYLERCLLSLIFNQSVLKDIEIIVVNDGSKDNTKNIAEKYHKMYPDTVFVINKTNGGHGSTINEGIKYSKSKYFKVVDADDWVDIDSFESFVNDLKHIDTDVIITNYVYENVFDNSYKIVKYPILKDNKSYSFDNIVLDDYFPIHSITYKRSILVDNNINLDIHTFYVDMEYLIQPLPYLNDFTYLDYDLYRYFIGRPDQSVNINSFIKHRKDHEKVIKNVLSVYENKLVGSNKEFYGLNIIKTLLRTHYIIYCKSNKKDKMLKNEIREFSKYLKFNYKSVFKLLINENLFIKWNIRTNFIFSQMCNCLFSRIADKFDRGGRNECKKNV